MRVLGLASALAMAGIAGPASAQTGAVNPLQGDIGVHDPVMIKAGGTYYVFYTGNGVAVKTSTDRIRWKNIGAAFGSLPAWHKQYVPGAGSSLWAPDIHFRDGKYWLYYSVSTFGSNVSAIGLATAAALDPAAGATRWQDEGMVFNTEKGDDYNAIDPNVALDAAGVPWLVFGSFWSGIKMVKLDAATGKPAAGASLLSLAQHAGGIEGAFIFRRGGYYYLFVSWDKCCQGANSTYNIRVGRSAAITGPYADSKGKAMPDGGGDLIDDGDDRWKGPGHNGIFAEHDTVFLVNHAYDAERNGASTLWIRPLYWTPQGWPTLDANAGTTAAVPRAFRSARARREPSLRIDARGRVLPRGRSAARAFARPALRP